MRVLLQRYFVREATNVIHPQTRGETAHTHFVWRVSPGGVSRLGVDYVRWVTRLQDTDQRLRVICRNLLYLFNPTQRVETAVALFLEFMEEASCFPLIRKRVYRRISAKTQLF